MIRLRVSYEVKHTRYTIIDNRYLVQNMQQYHGGVRGSSAFVLTGNFSKMCHQELVRINHSRKFKSYAPTWPILLIQGFLQRERGLNRNTTKHDETRHVSDTWKCGSLSCIFTHPPEDNIYMYKYHLRIRHVIHVT